MHLLQAAKLKERRLLLSFLECLLRFLLGSTLLWEVGFEIRRLSKSFGLTAGVDLVDIVGTGELHTRGTLLLLHCRKGFPLQEQQKVAQEVARVELLLGWVKVEVRKGRAQVVLVAEELVALLRLRARHLRC